MGRSLHDCAGVIRRGPFPQVIGQSFYSCYAEEDHVNPEKVKKSQKEIMGVKKAEKNVTKFYNTSLEIKRNPSL